MWSTASWLSGLLGRKRKNRLRSRAHEATVLSQRGDLHGGRNRARRPRSAPAELSLPEAGILNARRRPAQGSLERRARGKASLRNRAQAAASAHNAPRLLERHAPLS